MKKKIVILVILIISLGLTACNDSRIKTIEYESNGGSEIEKKLYLEGQKIESPLPKPIKQYSIFGGWFIDKDLTIEFTETIIKNDYKLYAKWELCEEQLQLKIELADCILSKSDFEQASVFYYNNEYYVLRIKLKNEIRLTSGSQAHIYYNDILVSSPSIVSSSTTTEVFIEQKSITEENHKELLRTATKINNWINA